MVRKKLDARRLRTDELAGHQSAKKRMQTDRSTRCVVTNKEKSSIAIALPRAGFFRRGNALSSYP